MLIESLIKRKDGTPVQLDDELYLFDDTNNHRCIVTNKDHIDIFLNNGAFCEAITKKPKAEKAKIDEPTAVDNESQI